VGRGFSAKNALKLTRLASSTLSRVASASRVYRIDSLTFRRTGLVLASLSATYALIAIVAGAIGESVSLACQLCACNVVVLPRGLAVAVTVATSRRPLGFVEESVRVTFDFAWPPSFRILQDVGQMS
jgi:hypothetical protein